MWRRFVDRGSILARSRHLMTILQPAPRVRPPRAAEVEVAAEEKAAVAQRQRQVVVLQAGLRAPEPRRKLNAMT